jgi:hypothetical protein
MLLASPSAPGARMAAREGECGATLPLALGPYETVKLQCTLPVGHDGDHYDDAFSREWESIVAG